MIGVGREGGAGESLVSTYEAVDGVPDVETLLPMLKRHRPEVVFHLAGVTQAASFAEFLDVNFGYCSALIDACRQMPIRPLLVTAGSAAEYGAPQAPGRPMRESDEARPVTDYGKAKLAQTNLALQACELSTVALRLFNVIGPGAPETSAPGRFVARAAALAPTGGVVKTGPLTAVRDLVCVTDVVKVMVGATHGRLPQGVYNVCSGAGTPISAITDVLARLLPYPVAFEPERGNPGPDIAIGDPSRLAAAGFVIPAVDLEAVLTGMAIAAGIPLEREIA